MLDSVQKKQKLDEEVKKLENSVHNRQIDIDKLYKNPLSKYRDL